VTGRRFAASMGVVVWTWVISVVGYAVSLFAFQILGGISAAGRAFENWGRRSSERRLEKSGLSPESFARSRVSRR
jgi:hypothetical protein